VDAVRHANSLPSTEFNQMSKNKFQEAVGYKPPWPIATKG